MCAMALLGLRLVSSSAHLALMLVLGPFEYGFLRFPFLPVVDQPLRSAVKIGVHLVGRLKKLIRVFHLAFDCFQSRYDLAIRFALLVHETRCCDQENKPENGKKHTNKIPCLIFGLKSLSSSGRRAGRFSDFGVGASVRRSGEIWRRSRKPPCRTNAYGRLSIYQ